MLFNSIEFAFFLPIVFIIYWLALNKNLNLQNLFLIGASYLFYGWWDWRFLSLIVFSSIVDFFVGIGMSKEGNAAKRKNLLFVSIFVNLGFLAVFKYFNFFVESFVSAFSIFGFSFDPVRLNIILPVGISFYTFQTLSYSIDVYKKKIEPTKNIVAFFAFVSFFPQLVAGPIERASNLLPQFFVNRKFEYGNAVNGLKQVLWGLFKKMVIADNCAVYVNMIFDNPTEYTGSALLLGAVFFALQIYGDFSGYSDIAIGLSRLFGFNLLQNFSFPYFSRDIAEFWRRWHISLSSWFRDYLYFPLGGSRLGLLKSIRNTFIVFIVSGFWHGANWTFIFWGFLNALFFMPLMLTNQNRKNLDVVANNGLFPSIKEFFQVTATFLLVVFAWIFFRADSIECAFAYIKKLFSLSLFAMPNIDRPQGAVLTTLFIIFFTAIEWLGRRSCYAIERINVCLPRTLRWVFYYGIAMSLYLFSGKEQQFIYFQF